ncbi:hypothetical protein EBL87_09030 [Cereibacter sphaeroides]|uniref:hypothetical protein n=1 Tax=Cereibacter sphaeroides TaxID=1063 RepID=UPI000F52D27C|nr:hypothetical protein [Cereibacter sphaeroides]AZB63871.1 hypothetical protein EBL87_09030 [Cereibacter sphaeroides]AZB68207.1 hypothetical protein EBL86_07440 [Cereibacter sphaeroides]
MSLIPSTLRAGETITIPVTLTALPPPDWSLTLILRGPDQIDLVSAPDGAAHTFSAAAAITSEWAAGKYWWSLRATMGTTVVIVEEGQLVVLGDLALVAGPHDGSSHAERVLRAIEAVIEGRASIDQQKYTIAGRELWRTPVADLLLLRSRYRDEVRREQQAGRKGQSLLGRVIKARFL